MGKPHRSVIVQLDAQAMSPDPSWIQVHTATGASLSSCQVLWDKLTRTQRLRRWNSHRKKEAKVLECRARVMAGTADKRTRTYADRGGVAVAQHRGQYHTPEPRWRELKLSEGMRPDEIEPAWSALRPSQRAVYWANHARRDTVLVAHIEKVETGTANTRTITYVHHKGLRIHASDEDANHAWVQDKVIRDSQERLDMRVMYNPGCSIDGCPLAPGGWLMFTLLENDHVDPSTKVAEVTSMRGIARHAEQLKTVCLCVWHHFVRTREQRNHRPIEERVLTAYGKSHLVCATVLWKETTHCEHPMHAQMPYASLVPQADDDALMVGFLQTSHVLRGVRSVEGSLTDLLSGAAVVHCKFCHLLWTLCETTQMSQRPFTAHQYSQLSREYPAFVAHFLSATAGFDWKAEKRRVHDLVVKPRTRKHKQKQQ